MPIIDMRSDTVTKPTEAMYEAMRAAPLGDDGWGDDPTVQQLESVAAAMLGKEAAVLTPSGTMANLLTLLCCSKPGGEVVLEATSHIVRSEMGGVATLAGMSYRGVAGRRGAMDIEELRMCLSPSLTRRQLATSIVCMETTHVAAGGAVLALDHMRAVADLAHQNGAHVHLDGSRIFNAATALGAKAAAVANHCDSVSTCLSKGLSAPVGSLLAGSKTFIERSRAFRRMVGGTMRQAGIIAAAGLVALSQMVERLQDDHRTAQALAQGLHKIDPSFVEPGEVETNIVMVRIGHTRRNPEQWLGLLQQHGILTSVVGKGVLRFVTHRHINLEDVSTVLQVFASAG